MHFRLTGGRPTEPPFLPYQPLGDLYGEVRIGR